MIRRLVAGLIVVGLAVGIWALWPREDSEPTPTTVPGATASTTNIPPTTTPTTALTATSSTTSLDTHVVTTVEEAEAILQELWFGWFEGIYNQDEERIKEVVATQAMLDSAREAFGVVYESAPSPGGVVVSETEVLRSDQSCLVAYTSLDVTDFAGAGSVETSVVVVRRVMGDWRLATVWINRNDLWEQDCESQLESLS